MYDGAITIRYDVSPKTGKRTPYKYIRLTKGKWDLYHRHLWKKHNGPIPAKHVIIFKDGNSLNCILENLDCITMAENARRNTNREKFKQTLALQKEEGEHPSYNLTDSYILGIVAKGNKQTKKLITEEYPEIIQAKRAQLQLNRKIKHHEKQNNRPK